MKVYKTEHYNGSGGSPVPISVYYEVEDDHVEIKSITSEVYHAPLHRLIEGDVTCFIDEFAYDGIKSEIYELEELQ